MASSQRKMEEARAARKAAALLSRLQQENTTTWVDEAYADRLTKSLHADILAESKQHVVLYLNRLRKSKSYLFEEPIVRGTRAWALDTSKGRKGWLFISPFDYDKNGKWKAELVAPTPIYLSPHSMGRIYLRLRSNSGSDFKAIVKQLVVLGDPADHAETEEFEVSVPGGRFFVVRDNINEGLPAGTTVSVHVGDEVRTEVLKRDVFIKAQPIWVVKTFIADKPK